MHPFLVPLLATLSLPSVSNSLSPQNPWPSSHLFVSDKLRLRQDYNNFAFVIKARKLQSALRRLANEEMAVTAVQSLFDRLQFTREKLDVAQELYKSAQGLSSSFDSILDKVESIRSVVGKYFDSAPLDMTMFRHYTECCALDKHQIRYESSYNSFVNNSISCDILPPEPAPFVFYPGPQLTKTFIANANQLEMVRWQYFISAEGAHLEYPAHSIVGDMNTTACIHNENKRHRDVFLATTLPYVKRIIIIVENGASMQYDLLNVAKEASKVLVSSLWHTDLVTVMTLNQYSTFYCSTSFINATSKNKQNMYSFIDSIRKENGHTNHSLGLMEAFKLLESEGGRGGQDYVIYLSRGLLSSLQEAGQVMATILRHNLKANLTVQINTLPIMNRGKIPLWELQFLQDLALQNFTKYNNSIPNQLLATFKERGVDPPTGKMMVVNGTGGHALSLARLVDLFRRPEANLDKALRKVVTWSQLKTDTTVTLWPPAGQILSRESDWLVSVSAPVWKSDTFVGVIGVDISIGSLIAPIKYSTPTNNSHYMFLMDSSGSVIWHRKLLSAEFVSLSLIENIDQLDADKLLDEIGVENVGTMQIRVNVGDNSTTTRIYYWKRIKHTPFTLVSSAPLHSTNTRISLANNNAAGIRWIAYHRLDLRINSDINKYCLNGRQLSSIERGSVFLSASCFRNPLSRILRPESRLLAAGLWAHFGSDLIRNPGLKAGVKGDVNALSSIVHEWTRLHSNSPLKHSVVRRFAATPKGVLVTFPAGVLPPQYDPTKRQWFYGALESKGQVFISTPYLDPSGLGYIVTLSHSIYEGKHAALHSPSDMAAAVVGIDVPLSFMHKLLMDSISVCNEVNTNCLLLDHKGYVVAQAPRSIPLADREPVEGQHLTRLHPLLAADLLQHKHLIRKDLCVELGPGLSTNQRLYQLNISYDGVIRQDDSGCSVFMASMVPRTNVLFVVLNTSCGHHQAAFCPCSVSDRRCLNCYRSDPIECECPCECPANSGDCGKWDMQTRTCPPPQTPFNKLPQINAALLSELAIITAQDGQSKTVSTLSDSLLPDCIPVNCQTRAGMADCLGLVGCQWCFTDGKNKPLNGDSFCAPIALCFGGVKGRSPEGLVAYNNDSFMVSTPVGPVAGAIMAVFVLLCVAVYCYRNQVARLVEGRSNSCESGARLNLNEEEEEYQFDHNGSSDIDDNSPPNNNILLASFERNAPQARAPFWRPGPRTESSDHGYSTMTGNCDDSEHATSVDLITPANRRNKLFYTINQQQSCAPASTEKLLVGDSTCARLEQVKESTALIEDIPIGMTSLDESLLADPTTLVTIEAQVHAIDAN